MDVISREYVEAELKRYKFPGMGIGVIKDGKVMMSEGFGYKDIEKKTKITGDTQFGIASCSKSFTATLIGMLVDRGLLGWEQPIREYLPDFRMYDPHATELCSIKDMLCHRTGLGGYDAPWFGANIESREVLWERLRYMKPSAPFRSQIQYSNIIYTIAGHIAERLTGKTYEQLLKEMIFEPLGMTRSNATMEQMLADGDHATPYWQGKDTTLSGAELYWKSSEGPYKIKSWNTDLGAPAAGINSTVNDMLKWLQFQLDDGIVNGERLISHESMEEIHLQHVRYHLWQWRFDEVPPMGGYALGWYNDVYRGHYLYWHLGEIEGYGTMQFVLPRDNLGIVVFNNIQKPDVLIQLSVVYSIIDHVLGLSEIDWSSRMWEQRENYGHMLEDWRIDMAGDSCVKDTRISHDLDAYTGKYYEPGHGIIEIIREGDSLKCLYRGVKQDMIHMHYDVFKVPDVKQDTLLYTCPINFLTNAQDGSIDRFEFKLYTQIGPLVFERI